MSDKKEYPKLKDVLPLGRWNLKFFPKHKWDKEAGKFTDEHHSGQSKHGKWWLYNAKLGGKYYSEFANEKNKKFFDSGTVEINVVPKLVNGEPSFNAEGKANQTGFINEYDGVGKIITEIPDDEEGLPF